MNVAVMDSMILTVCTIPSLGARLAVGLVLVRITAQSNYTLPLTTILNGFTVKKGQRITSFSNLNNGFQCRYCKYTHSVATLQTSSNCPTFPGISPRGINIYYTTRAIQTDLRVCVGEYCGKIGSPSCAYQLHLPGSVYSLRLYHNCSSKPRSNHYFSDF